MKMATTLIVVTLAVVGSNTSQDPAQASQVGSAVISESKLKELKGQDKTLASRSSAVDDIVRGNKNVETIEIRLGSPTNNKLFAKYYISQEYNWSGDQYKCLVNLWQHESGWSHLSKNSESGAYGIPQSLPATKMASEGKDWKTNPATQIKWGTKYIKLRYGTPCDAYKHFKLHNWY